MVLIGKHLLRVPVVAALCAMLLAAVPAYAAEQYQIKFATLAPSGTTWMNLMEDWARDVKTRSQGRLTFKFYPGGVMGDEPDVLRKIRSQQLDGGAFSGYGIGRIYSPARILELPFLLMDFGEIDYVRAQFMPEIEKGFRDNGYELLGWMEVGFVHFFSRDPINSLDDLKNRRIWLWQGDALGQAMFTASDLAPIPLSITDVFTSLSTGLIDTVYCTPLASIALQWFTKVNYMTNTPMANGIGAMVVSTRSYDRLPPDLQQILKETGKVWGEKLIQATRDDNEKSLKVLAQRGLKFTFDPEDTDPAEFYAIRDRAAAELAKNGYIPAAVFDRTRTLLDAYRKQTAGTAASGHASRANP